MRRAERLVIALQNVAEFWNVATRPVASNGLGFSIEEARDELAKFETFFEILSESAATYEAWKALLIAHRVMGVQVHDTRLVSVMKAYGVVRIFRFNVADFARFAEVEAVHPDEVV